MTRRMQFVTLAMIVGVSVFFGALVGSTINRPPSVAASAAGGLSLPALAASGGAVAAAPSFADIVERVNPAVVAIQNIEVKKARRTARRGFNPFEFFFQDPQNPHGQRQDGEGEPDSGGMDDSYPEIDSASGFIITKDGYILTNNHVVADATKLTVTLDNGEKYPATLKGKDAGIDVALLKIEAPHDLPVLPLGDSDSIRIGEWVLAVGNPLGNALGPDHSVTVGVVSAKGRRLQDLGNDVSLANYIQTDAAINFGNSGGPLVNSRGEAIGINTAITRNYNNVPGLIQGIGFALPIDQAKSVLDQLMSTGRVARGYLSIVIGPVDDNTAEYYHMENKKGALVQSVNPGGPADRGGVKSGDIIVSVDGTAVDDNTGLIRLISARKPGETVELGVFREVKDHTPSKTTLKVKLADREIAQNASNRESDEGEPSRPASSADLGFSVRGITPRDVANAGWRTDPPNGVIVTNVDPQGHAFDVGISEGALVTKIGRQEVGSVADFNKAAESVKKGDVVRVTLALYDTSNRTWVSRFVFFKAE